MSRTSDDDLRSVRDGHRGRRAPRTSVVAPTDAQLPLPERPTREQIIPVVRRVLMPSAPARSPGDRNETAGRTGERTTIPHPPKVPPEARRTGERPQPRLATQTPTLTPTPGVGIAGTNGATVAPSAPPHSLEPVELRKSGRGAATTRSALIGFVLGFAVALLCVEWVRRMRGPAGANTPRADSTMFVR